jgi:hypothetical protein
MQQFDIAVLEAGNPDYSGGFNIADALKKIFQAGFPGKECSERYARLLKCVYSVLTARSKNDETETLHIVCGSAYSDDIISNTMFAVYSGLFLSLRKKLSFATFDAPKTAKETKKDSVSARLIFDREQPMNTKCKFFALDSGETNIAEDVLKKYDSYGFIDEIAQNPQMASMNFFKNIEDDLSDYGCEDTTSMGLFKLVWGADRNAALTDEELPVKLGELLKTAVPNRYPLDEQIIEVFTMIQDRGIELDDQIGEKLANLSSVSSNKILVDLCTAYTLKQYTKMEPEKIAVELNKLYSTAESRESYTFRNTAATLIDNDNGKAGLKAFYELVAQNTGKERDPQRAIKALAEEIRKPECAWFSLGVYETLKLKCVELIKEEAKSSGKNAKEITDDSFELLKYVFEHDSARAKEALLQIKEYFMEQTANFGFTPKDQALLKAFYIKYLQVFAVSEIPTEQDLTDIAREVRGNLELNKMSYEILEEPCLNYLKNHVESGESGKSNDEIINKFDHACIFIAKEVFKQKDFRKLLVKAKEHYRDNNALREHVYISLAASVGDDDSLPEFAEDVRANVTDAGVREKIYGILMEKTYRKYKEKILKKTATADMLVKCEKELGRVFADCPHYKDNCLEKIKHEYWESFNVEEMDLTGDQDYAAISTDTKSEVKDEKQETARKFNIMAKNFKDGLWDAFCLDLAEMLPMKRETFAEKKTVIQKITATCLEYEANSTYITRVMIDDYYYLWFFLAALNEEKDPLDFLIRKRLLLPERLTPDVLRNCKNENWYAVNYLPTRYKGNVAFLDYLNERKGSNKVVDDAFKRIDAHEKGTSKRKGGGLGFGGLFGRRT